MIFFISIHSIIIASSWYVKKKDLQIDDKIDLFIYIFQETN